MRGETGSRVRGEQKGLKDKDRRPLNGKKVPSDTDCRSPSDPSTPTRLRTEAKADQPYQTVSGCLSQESPRRGGGREHLEKQEELSAKSSSGAAGPAPGRGPGSLRASPRWASLLERFESQSEDEACHRRSSSCSSQVRRKSLPSAVFSAKVNLISNSLTNLVISASNSRSSSPQSRRSIGAPCSRFSTSNLVSSRSSSLVSNASSDLSDKEVKHSPRSSLSSTSGKSSLKVRDTFSAIGCRSRPGDTSGYAQPGSFIRRNIPTDSSDKRSNTEEGEDGIKVSDATASERESRRASRVALLAATFDQNQAKGSSLSIKGDKGYNYYSSRVFDKKVIGLTAKPTPSASPAMLNSEQNNNCRVKRFGAEEEDEGTKLSVKEKVLWLESAAKESAGTFVKKAVSSPSIASPRTVPRRVGVTSRYSVSANLEDHHLQRQSDLSLTSSKSLPVPHPRQRLSLPQSPNEATQQSNNLTKLVSSSSFAQKDATDFASKAPCSVSSNRLLPRNASSLTNLISHHNQNKQPTPQPRRVTVSEKPNPGTSHPNPSFLWKDELKKCEAKDRKDSGSDSSSFTIPHMSQEEEEQDDNEYEIENIYEPVWCSPSVSSPNLSTRRVSSVGSVGRRSVDSGSLGEDFQWFDSSDSGSYSSNNYEPGVIKASSPCPPPLPPRIHLTSQSKVNNSQSLISNEKSRMLVEVCDNSANKSLKRAKEAAPIILDAYEEVVERLGESDVEHIYQGIYDIIQKPEVSKNKVLPNANAIDENTLKNLIQVIQEIQVITVQNQSNSPSTSSSSSSLSSTTTSNGKTEPNSKSIFSRLSRPKGHRPSPRSNLRKTAESVPPPRPSKVQGANGLSGHDEPDYANLLTDNDNYVNFPTILEDESVANSSLLESIINCSDDKVKDFLDIGDEPQAQPEAESQKRPNSLSLIDTGNKRSSVTSTTSSTYIIPSSFEKRSNINDLEDNLGKFPFSNVKAVKIKRRPSERSYLEFQTSDKSPFDDEPLYQFYVRDVKIRTWLNMDPESPNFDFDSESIYSESIYSMPNEKVAEDNLTDKESCCGTGQRKLACKWHQSAMELVGSGPRRLWCEIPQVKESGLLERLTSQQRKLQEAMFELISSEASYIKSLDVLVDHFHKHFESVKPDILKPRERKDLFSSITLVREVAKKLFAELDHRWQESMLISDISDIMLAYATNHFVPYVLYCQYQMKQERTLRELRARPEFAEALKRLESNAKCQGLDIHSFILLPMQRVTRYPLLMDAIYQRIDKESPLLGGCSKALVTLSKLCADCNDAANKFERWHELVDLDRKLRFDNVKSFPLVSSSRWLLKKGEVTRLAMDYPSLRIGTLSRTPRWSKSQNYLFLFNDLLIIAKKKSDDHYNVLDYCHRDVVHVSKVEEEPSSNFLVPPNYFKYRIGLELLQNNNGKQPCCYFNFSSESERQRWVDAIEPPKSENPNEKIYEEWDCPQVICRRPYTALQPDEISLDEADSINVFRKLNDWYEGERIRDGERGWFPADCTEEVVNRHVRARNLKLRHRLMVLTQVYLQQTQRPQHQQQQNPKKSV